ncbi:MAG TPA: hypothetical protein VFZ81_00895 [Burkholderiales bacterium]
MKIHALTASLRGVVFSLSLFAPAAPGAHAQSATPAMEVVWSATRDFGGKMMDVDRFDNVYSAGDTIVGGIVLTRKFSADEQLATGYFVLR